MFLVLESFADKTKSENRYLLDEQVLVADISAYLFNDTVPFVSGYFDAAYGCNDIGSCPSDVTILIDQNR